MSKRVKRNRAVEAKTGPGTGGVVVSLLDFMNKNGLKSINVTKSTLESIVAGEVKLEVQGREIRKENIKDGFTTLESRRMNRQRAASRHKALEARGSNESTGSKTFLVEYRSKGSTYYRHGPDGRRASLRQYEFFAKFDDKWSHDDKMNMSLSFWVDADLSHQEIRMVHKFLKDNYSSVTLSDSTQPGWDISTGYGPTASKRPSNEEAKDWVNSVGKEVNTMLRNRGIVFNGE